MIEKRQIAIADVIASRPDEIIRKAIDAHVTDFSRDSLVRKTRTLCRLIRPTSMCSKKYTFSEDRLERIDSIRHKCAHGGFDVADFSTFQEDLEYLENTAHFFIEAAAVALGIDIGPMPDIRNIISPPAPDPPQLVDTVGIAPCP